MGVCEDQHPCYDIESDWVIVPGECRPQKTVYQHKDCKSLFRIIDYKKQMVAFTDEERIAPADIIDINRDIGMERKCEIQNFIIRVMAMEKPVSMPYIHDRIKVYVEDIDDYIGVLYYMDTDEEKNIVAIKRYFRVTKDPILSFKEVTNVEYNEKRRLYFEKEDKKDVD